MFYQAINPPISLLNEYTHQNVIVKDFKITTHPTKDQDHLEALSSGKPLKRNDILDISTNHKIYIFNSFQENINELRKCDIKFVCVVDITDFPVIKSYIDDTNTCKINANSLFNNHFMTLWDNYSINHVITVTINLHFSHIDLQLLPFRFANVEQTEHQENKTQARDDEIPTLVSRVNQIPMSSFVLPSMSNMMFDGISVPSFMFDTLS
jgi:hypothetical protein